MQVELFRLSPITVPPDISRDREELSDSLLILLVFTKRSKKFTAGFNTGISVQ